MVQMNDFTKEELQELRDLLEPESDWQRLTELQYALRDRIQSLINNYCEHQWQNQCTHS
jgi:hypothetical protein